MSRVIKSDHAELTLHKVSDDNPKTEAYAIFLVPYKRIDGTPAIQAQVGLVVPYFVTPLFGEIEYLCDLQTESIYDYLAGNSTNNLVLAGISEDNPVRDGLAEEVADIPLNSGVSIEQLVKKYRRSFRSGKNSGLVVEVSAPKANSIYDAESMMRACYLKAYEEEHQKSIRELKEGLENKTLIERIRMMGLSNIGGYVEFGYGKASPHLLDLWKQERGPNVKRQYPTA